MLERRRRTVVVFGTVIVALAASVISSYLNRPPDTSLQTSPPLAIQGAATSLAEEALQKLAIKGRAPKTGYSRSQFGNGWRDMGNCNMRNIILARDMKDVVVVSESDCNVVSGTLNDPYTNKSILFTRGSGSSAKVQIDHVVALSDAWQKGAQQLTADQRLLFANDPLNLLAVDGQTNNNKSDSDAATWLPPNKAYRCQYVARQIAVKQRYTIWITQAEHDAMKTILSGCPGQVLPIVSKTE